MLSIYKDTNTINSAFGNVFVNELEELAKKYPESLIIEKTDTLDTELLENRVYNANRLKKSNAYIESFGVAVLGHSRLGHTVVGSEADDRILTQILEIIFGKKLRSKYSKQEIRDAMHIMTSIRYGGTYFITGDKKILESSNKIRERFNSTIICSPKECLMEIKERLHLT